MTLCRVNVYMYIIVGSERDVLLEAKKYNFLPRFFSPCDFVSMEILQLLYSGFDFVLM